tara:strand:+ start:75 stop:497 length:423 start_codon:yes stop_codon:yes gene_type:complete
MGYRSTIIFGVEQSHAPKLDEILKEHKMIADLIVSKAYPLHKMVKDKHGDFEKWERLDDIQMVIYRFEYLKWYDDYPEVIAITKYLKGLAYTLEDSGVVESDDYDTTFLVGLGEEGEIHSAIADWWQYVDHISKLEIQDI